MPPSIESRIATELSVKPTQVAAAVALIDEGATVPFIARYRKEATGGLDDAQLRTLSERLVYLRELEERRAAIFKSIEEQNKLTPALRASIEAADSKQRLEDLYLPYKPKRRTKAQIAREAGLEPLAEALLADPKLDPHTEAARYLREPFTTEQGDNPGVPDAKVALDGARQILIERFAEDAELIGALRTHLEEQGVVVSTVVDGKQEVGAKFRDYFDYKEQLSKIPSHRALALFRGRTEEILRLALKLPEELEVAAAGHTAAGQDARMPRAHGCAGAAAGQDARMPRAHGCAGAAKAVASPNACELKIAARFRIALIVDQEGRPADAWLKDTVRWTWQVKVAWQLEADLFGALRERAEEEAIRVFGSNLHDLLLAAPAGARVTMGLDPGIRTGVKVAIVDRTGKVVDTATVYPFPPKSDLEGTLHTLRKLAEKHRVELIGIGNGTASRETDRLTAELIKRNPQLGLTKVVVSEAGASVYSASELASRELPELDVSLRGAVSIARRLQDPLAELVKIDPKSIGVGQYQHDVSQTKLAKSLDAVVEDCVNAVGVDVNMASPALLARVSGLTTSLAENIVSHRNQHGAFANREALRKVPRLGPKTFEQAAGFLRIVGGDNPLDMSAVHPEAYAVVKRILEDLQKPVKEVIGEGGALRKVEPARYTDERFGLPTVRDILRELEKPGRDPRPEFKTAAFKDGVEALTDLQPGMLLEGVVTNVTNFGAFVDVGVHQDGLVHISMMSHKFIKDPREVVKAGDVVKVKVLEVDVARKRIALTMKLDTAPPRDAGRSASADGQEPERRERRSAGAAGRSGASTGDSRWSQERPRQQPRAVGSGLMAEAFAKALKK